MADTAAPSVKRPIDPPLVGRDEEVGALLEVLDATRAGRGGVVLLEGEAGIGKTRLVAETVSRAPHFGLTVLSGSGDELDRGRPFGMAAQALRASKASEDARRRGIADLLEDPQEHATGARILDACMELLESTVLENGTLLVLEDLHWADPSSLLFLRGATDLVDLPLVVLGTVRPAPRRTELDAVLEAVLRQGARLVRVRPLDEDDARALAAHGDARGGADIAAIVDAAGGNPFYILELARSAVSAATGIPPTLRSTVLRRIAFLGDEVLDLLRVAAVLGSSFSVTDLAVIAKRSTTDLLPLLRHALAGSVVVEHENGLQFRHDLIRDALYEDMPSVVRKALHREIGMTLADAGSRPEAVAAQLVQGADPGDADALEWIARAGREVARRDPTIAIDLLEHAISLCGPDLERAARMEAETAVLLTWSGRPDEAIERVRRLGRLHRRDPDVAINLAEALLFSSRHVDAHAVAAAALPWAKDDRQRCILRAYASWGPKPDPTDTAREIRAFAERKNDAELLGLAYALESLPHNWGWRYRESNSLLERAIAAFEVAGTPRAGRMALLVANFQVRVLLALGRTEDARALRDVTRSRAERLGLTMLVWENVRLEADEALALARFDEARAALESTIDAPGIGGRIGTLISLAFVSLWTGARDRVEECRTQLLHLFAEIGAPDGGPDVAVLDGLIHFEDGDMKAAVTKLEATRTALADAGRGWIHALASPPLVKAAIASGEPELAEKVAASAREAVAHGAIEAPAVAAWCEGLAHDDLDRLRAGCDALAATPYRREAVVCREDVGDALAARGRRDEASEVFSAVLEAYAQMGMEPAVARVASRLRSLGVRRGVRGPRARSTTGWESLTAMEQQVVRLVAQGLTNPHIGRRLYISRHTVASHLKHVYAKLGVTSRVDLAAEVARRDI